MDRRILALTKMLWPIIASNFLWSCYLLKTILWLFCQPWSCPSKDESMPDLWLLGSTFSSSIVRQILCFLRLSCSGATLILNLLYLAGVLEVRSRKMRQGSTSLKSVKRKAKCLHHWSEVQSRRNLKMGIAQIFRTTKQTWTQQSSIY